MAMDLKQLAVAQPMLLQRAVEHLTRQFNDAPDDLQTGLRLARTLRELGHLVEARRVYGQLILRWPQCIESRVTLNILENKGWSGSKDDLDEFRPVPFLRFSEFLTHGQVKTIWQQVRLKQKDFKATTVNNNEYRPADRQSAVLYLQDLEPVAEWFLPRVKELVHERHADIGIAEFPSGKTELQMTQHGEASFFNAHQDTSGTGNYSLRRVTFVYYFFEEPRKFRGGDLLLFDYPASSDDKRFRYTRIVPANNELLLFPSNALHQVTPVQIHSCEFFDGRFTLNGWLSTFA